ncbi:MAG TPA: hypothetical protein VJH92_00990 [Candidatus Nanoarchaeia archaeon]|nr:hypothetical protein [Candidatus Nanoarchaeia archaeon]
MDYESQGNFSFPSYDLTTLKVMLNLDSGNLESEIERLDESQRVTQKFLRETKFTV